MVVRHSVPTTLPVQHGRRNHPRGSRRRAAGAKHCRARLRVRELPAGVDEQRVGRALDGVVADWELIFVDDESPDGSWSILCELSESDERIHAVRLAGTSASTPPSRPASTETRGRRVRGDGLRPPGSARGDAAALRQAAGGLRRGLARRIGRQHSWLRRVASHGYFRLLNALVGTQMSGDLGNYSDPFPQGRRRVPRCPGQRPPLPDRSSVWLGFDTQRSSSRTPTAMPAKSSYTFGMLLRSRSTAASSRRPRCSAGSSTSGS